MAILMGSDAKYHLAGGASALPRGSLGLQLLDGTHLILVQALAFAIQLLKFVETALGVVIRGV